MSQLGTVTDRILDAVHCAPGCQLDDLVLRLPELTWNQVFLEVDRLSRTRQVWVMAMGEGTYAISLPKKEKRTRTPISSRETQQEANHDSGCSGISDRLDRSRSPQPARR
jgi:hypothetical protein